METIMYAVYSIVGGHAEIKKLYLSEIEGVELIEGINSLNHHEDDNRVSYEIRPLSMSDVITEIQNELIYKMDTIRNGNSNIENLHYMADAICNASRWCGIVLKFPIWDEDWAEMCYDEILAIGTHEAELYANLKYFVDEC